VSYALSAGLQAAVYRRLAGDAELAALAGGAIYDAPPEGAPADGMPDYVTLGAETVRPNDTMTSVGALHDFTVTVHSARDGFERAKRIAATVCACLVDAPLALDGGRLVALRFLRATAERGRAPEKRRVSLRFRAVVDRDD
jgi:hypothetical protein